ncbi:hypothetical protein KM043_000480 [Ampulex compressa]|nr:hypothetical protein KM043_000480 [Ampulex compressa]
MKSTSAGAFAVSYLCFLLCQASHGYASSPNWNGTARLSLDSNIGARELPGPIRFFLLSPIQREADRIAGGYRAKDGQFPYMAVVHRLLDYGAVSQCGGTIISKRWVLTAGHCVANPPHRYFVVFGVVDKSGIGYDYNDGPGVSMMASRMAVHPEYFYSTNDIGLLYMPRDIPYTSRIRPISLASATSVGAETYADMTAYIVGWGRESSFGYGTRVLKYALMPIIPNSECHQYWKVDERNVCTAPGIGQNACQGDSGGPLVIIKNDRPLQIGIVSYGDSDCPSGRPGVFTRVSAFATWIESITGLRF